MEREKDHDAAEAGGAVKGDAFPEDLPGLILRPVGERLEGLRPALRAELIQRLEWVEPLRKGEDTAACAAEKLRSARMRDGSLSGGGLRSVRWLAWTAGLLILVGAVMNAYERLPDWMWKDSLPQWLKDAGYRQLLKVPRDDAPANLFSGASGDWRQVGAEKEWRKHPLDPAYYAQYVKRFRIGKEIERISDRRYWGAESIPAGEEGFPADYEETWRRIDPDNA